MSNKTERYFLLKGFLPDELIKYCEDMCNQLQQHESKVGNSVQKDKKRRKDVFLNRSQCAIVDEFFFSNKDYFEQLLGVRIAYRETYKIGIYDASDKGFYIPHTDTQGGMEHRKFSVVVCLSSSDDYTGGIFKFVNLNKSFKFDRGDAIVFDPNLLHGVEPVESGNRKVLISFMWDIDGEQYRANKSSVPNINYLPNLKVKVDDVIVKRDEVVKKDVAEVMKEKDVVEVVKTNVVEVMEEKDVVEVVKTNVVEVMEEKEKKDVEVMEEKEKKNVEVTEEKENDGPKTIDHVDKVTSIGSRMRISKVVQQLPLDRGDRILALIPPDSGPGNQLVAIKEALILAKLTGRTLLIPPIRSHYVISNVIFWSFQDIFQIMKDGDNHSPVYDTANQEVLNSLEVGVWHAIHANYFGKVLRHENYLKRKPEVLLKSRCISNVSDVQELEGLKDRVVVLKHLFNNLEISKCRFNGCFTCPLNPNFVDLYRSICQRFDYSEKIKKIGDQFVQQKLGEDYVAVHLRLPDLMYGKNLLEFTKGEISLETIFSKLRDIVSAGKKIFLASNQAEYLQKNAGIKKAVEDGTMVFYHSSGGSSGVNVEKDVNYASFVEQYLCGRSVDFYYLVVDGVRYRHPHCRSTFTSFVIDYRNYFLGKSPENSKPL